MADIILRTFQVNVTPPIGDYLCGGLHNRALGVETPLYLHGLILSANGTHYVLAGVDYCYLSGRSQQRIVAALAEAAGIPVTQATLHSNHVHDAPLIDEEAHAIMAESGFQFHNEAYFAKVLADTGAAIHAALAHEGATVASVSHAQHPVEQFASSRRVLDSKGRCQVRWSICRDEALRNAPEGRIDPMLDQIVFFDAGQTPLACLHFYASHPQVSDGRRMISADTIGVARDLFAQAFPGVFQIYFTGCAGDITAGKYTNADKPRNRLVLGVRLYDGMRGAFAKAAPRPVESLGWANHVIELQLRPLPEGSAPYEAMLRDPSAGNSTKYLAAMKVDRLRRGLQSYPFRVSRLRLGDVNILFLPTELVSEYQFYAKAHSPTPGRLAVAAYGDSFLKYVAHDRAFDEGGYEVDPNWSEVGKGIEAPICRGIDAVLGQMI
jgi:hypothetical protein